MKRIIDGVTYNTDTSTPVARYEYEDHQGYDTEATVYQTRGGALFIVHKWEVDGKGKVYFETSSRDQLLKLIEKQDNLEILNEDILQPPPEAVEETRPAATLYVRVPVALKERLETLAKDEDVSLNTWTMRCVERCTVLDEVEACLGGILSTGLCLNSETDPGYSENAVRAMVWHMYEEAQKAAELLGWRGEKKLIDLATAAAGTSHYCIFPLDEEGKQ